MEEGRPPPKNSPVRDLTLLMGDDVLLRIRGRIQLTYLAYEAKHPIVLQKGRVAELLVRDQHVVMSHAGVSALITVIRGAYWIVGLRCLAKRVTRSCVNCRRQDARSCSQPLRCPRPGSLGRLRSR